MSETRTRRFDRVSTPATYQDILDAPPDMVAQIIDGKLYTLPRPASAHAVASTAMVRSIGPPFDDGRGGPGGWQILYGPQLSLGDDYLVPDVGGWRRERMPAVPRVVNFTLPPDWICEVLSPSTRDLDLGRKRVIYAREGVGYLWLVDPDAQSLEAFELRGNEWTAVGTALNDAQVSLPPFEAVSFGLGKFWLPRVLHKCVPAREPAVEPQSESAEALK